MYKFSRTLGELVRKSRIQMGLTQMDISSALELDSRTILNMENYRGNPKLCVLYPLLRYLKIDANALFYPESQDATPTITQLQILLSDCTEEEAALLLPLCQTLIATLRSQKGIKIPEEIKRACLP